MNGRLFGACFSTLGHKEGAIAPVDYLSTFATAPVSIFTDKFALRVEIPLCLIKHWIWLSKFAC